VGFVGVVVAAVVVDPTKHRFTCLVKSGKKSTE